jgi:hypothetical protein
MPYWLILGFFGPMRSLSEADKLIENGFLKPTRDLYYKLYRVESHNGIQFGKLKP